MLAFTKKFILSLIITISLQSLILHSPAQAKNLVSGKYVSASGKKIELRLIINSSSPINLIVQQQIASSNRIIATSPKAKKINAKAGKIKWLCKKRGKGQLTLSTRLQSPLKGGVSATIRYKKPGGGFATLNISP